MKKNFEHSNKDCYQILLRGKFEKPYVHTFWERDFW